MPFHGGNTGSNPVGDANDINHLREQSGGDVRNLSNIRLYTRLNGIEGQ